MKNNKQIKLSSPTIHRLEKRYVNIVMRHNEVSSYGSNLYKVEGLIKQWTDNKYCVNVSSGTSAIHLAIKLAGVRPGDYVFCSDLTFVATANPILYEGGIPIFIDSEYETWNMDPAALDKAFKKYPQTKVVVVADLYGTVAKMDAIRDICNQHHAILIEDAAEALGASYNGAPAGSFGDYNIISFNGNKIITGASGGALLTNSETKYREAVKLANQSKDVAPWYQHSQIGYNYRMNNITASILLGQFHYLSKHIHKKQTIYKRYQRGLAGLPVTMEQIPKGCCPNYWLSCFLVDHDAMCTVQRNDKISIHPTKAAHMHTCPDIIVEELSQHNIECRAVWKPMHLQPLFKNNLYITVNNGESVSEDLFNRGLCLPSDVKMTLREQRYVMKNIFHCFH